MSLWVYRGLGLFLVAATAAIMAATVVRAESNDGKHDIALSRIQVDCDTWDIIAGFTFDKDGTGEEFTPEPAGENYFTNKSVLVGGISIAEGIAPKNPVANDVGPGTIVIVQLVRDDNTILATTKTQTDPSECETPTLEPASISITLDTDPEINDSDDVRFDFDGNLGDFNLEDDEIFTVGELSAGDYRVQLGRKDGYELQDIDCEGGFVDIDDESREVSITLEAGDDVTCNFQVATLPTPTPEATATSEPIPTLEPIATPEATPEIIIIGVEDNDDGATISPPSTGSAGLR